MLLCKKESQVKSTIFQNQIAEIVQAQNILLPRENIGTSGRTTDVVLPSPNTQ